MKWDDTCSSNPDKYRWYDLIADNDGLLGYIRHSLDEGIYTAVINDHGGPTAKFDNLQDAKGHIIAYYVAQKLEGGS